MPGRQPSPNGWLSGYNKQGLNRFSLENLAERPWRNAFVTWSWILTLAMSTTSQSYSSTLPVVVNT